MGVAEAKTEALRVPGIHHVTAISGRAQQNVDFYADTLGLRTIKQTVNFDDPGTHHLYYGDRAGTPGTAMTFFPWEHAAHGEPGSGSTEATGFSVPPGSLEFWTDRLRAGGFSPGEVVTRFQEESLRCEDPDGLVLELVAGPATRETSAGRPVHPGVPPEFAIRAFHGVVLDIADPEPTARLLTDVMGFEHMGEHDGRIRFRGDEHEVGSIVDLRAAGSGAPAHMGRGSVHHVAFRARDDDEQESWRETIAAAGFSVTEVKDRCYFRSIYFREPGGVLFEIATDTPGFGIDESPEELGRSLKLPPWLESRRSELEARLPKLMLPDERS
ncbi:MAG: ring-cleaving dioxygenase [Gemmatimonadetes bacterium]|nr:ring-cleaving dioxygenase [Gemmatimonadota bacterium]